MNLASEKDTYAQGQTCLPSEVAVRLKSSQALISVLLAVHEAAGFTVD
jgi:hypothetical protein